MSLPSILLRLEGLLLAGLCLAAYRWLEASWLQFAILALVPDVGIFGYMVNGRIGAVTYNLTHFEGWPILLAFIGLTGSEQVLPFALIWAAHIGIDRALGLGLKYPTSFRTTHLQRTE